jgi:hypothetical protein
MPNFNESSAASRSSPQVTFSFTIRAMSRRISFARAGRPPRDFQAPIELEAVAMPADERHRTNPGDPAFLIPGEAPTQTAFRLHYIRRKNSQSRNRIRRTVPNARHSFAVSRLTPLTTIRFGTGDCAINCTPADPHGHHVRGVPEGALHSYVVRHLTRQVRTFIGSSACLRVPR